MGVTADSILFAVCDFFGMKHIVYKIMYMAEV